MLKDAQQIRIKFDCAYLVILKNNGTQKFKSLQFDF